MRSRFFLRAPRAAAAPLQRPHQARSEKGVKSVWRS
jgi:hypothetical protein